MTQMNLFTKTDIDTQTQKTNLWLPSGMGGEQIGSLGLTDANYFIQDG